MNAKYHLIYMLVIILLMVCFASSVKRCTNIKNNNDLLEHNIESLNDTISYYTAKNGELIASKKILISDMKLLNTVNKELSDELKNMKLKNAELISKIDGIISNPNIDTTYIFDSTYIYKDFIKDFKFNNRWRLLEGNIEMKSNNLTMNIEKDEMYFDYTVAIHDNKLYISSSNPYIKYNNIFALKEPVKQRQKHFSIGANIGFGANYNMIDRKFGIGPYIGIGLSYNFALF